MGVLMIFQVTSICTSVCLKRVSQKGAHADPAPGVVPKVEEGCGTSYPGQPLGSLHCKSSVPGGASLSLCPFLGLWPVAAVEGMRHPGDSTFLCATVTDLPWRLSGVKRQY